MSYPKWVSRGYGLGEILCLTAEEEAAVIAARDGLMTFRVPEPGSVEITSIGGGGGGEQRKKPGPKPKVK